MGGLWHCFTNIANDPDYHPMIPSYIHLIPVLLIIQNYGWYIRWVLLYYISLSNITTDMTFKYADSLWYLLMLFFFNYHTFYFYTNWCFRIPPGTCSLATLPLTYTNGTVFFHTSSGAAWSGPPSMYLNAVTIFKLLFIIIATNIVAIVFNIISLLKSYHS